jgi:hypothetical protein
MNHRAHNVLIFLLYQNFEVKIHIDTQKNGSNKVRQNLSKFVFAAKLNFWHELHTLQN